MDQQAGPQYPVVDSAFANHIDVAKTREGVGIGLDAFMRVRPDDEAGVRKVHGQLLHHLNGRLDLLEANIPPMADHLRIEAEFDGQELHLLLDTMSLRVRDRHFRGNQDQLLRYAGIHRIVVAPARAVEVEARCPGDHHLFRTEQSLLKQKFVNFLAPQKVAGQPIANVLPVSEGGPEER